MQHEVSIEIDRGIDEVFDFTNHHVAEWSKTVVSSEPQGDQPHGVGSKFHLVTEDGGRRMDFEGVVTVWQPPRRSTVVMTGKSFDIEARYEFEDLGGSTRVTQVGKVRGKGAMGWFLRLFGWLFHGGGTKAAQSEFANLKRLLEARPR